MKNRHNAIAAKLVLGLLVTLLAVAGTAEAAAGVNLSRTHGLEPGDWVLVQATGFAASGNVTIAIDGTTVFQGKLDGNGAVSQSVQVPYSASAGYTKLTVTDNVNSVDVSIQIKGSLESFVETMQSLSPLAKILVGIFIILLPVLLFLWLWQWMTSR